MAINQIRKHSEQPKITSPSISPCTQLEVDISLQIILMDSLLADLNAAMEASLTHRAMYLCIGQTLYYLVITCGNEISFLPCGELRISGI